MLYRCECKFKRNMEFSEIWEFGAGVFTMGDFFGLVVSGRCQLRLVWVSLCKGSSVVELCYVCVVGLSFAVAHLFPAPR